MNTYTWKIESLDCKPDGDSKIVSCIHWRLKGDDGTNTTEVYGSQAIENNTENVFIDYEALTKDQVIAWAQEAMGADVVATLQASIDSQLEALANPPVIKPPLPWIE
jgi:hypothetical protein